MKRHYVIAERLTGQGLFQLWEHEDYGDEVAAILTLDGVQVCHTWDDIDTSIRDYIEA